MLHPAGVRVGHEPVARLKLRRHGKDARDVRIRIAADLELETPIAFRTIARHLRGHLLRRFLRDGAIEMHVLAVTPAEQFAHGHSSRLAEDIPARDVEAALHVGMALESGVHRAVELHELARIFTEQVRPEFAQTSAHAFRVGRQIERPERTDLAVADETGVGLDADDGAIEDGDGLAAGPFVGCFVEREFNAMGKDAGDFHS